MAVAWLIGCYGGAAMDCYSLHNKSGVDLDGLEARLMYAVDFAAAHKVYVP